MLKNKIICYGAFFVLVLFLVAVMSFGGRSETQNNLVNKRIITRINVSPKELLGIKSSVRGDGDLVERDNFGGEY
jgi:hypothetical protein